MSNGQAPQLSVLIVGYNTREMVAELLRGVFEHTAEITYEVLLVDNSDDGTEDRVRRDFPDVRVVPAERNLGFAAGNNHLARHARGTYVLLLNPDTLVEDNALGELVSFADTYPDAAAWGGLCLVPPDRSVDPACLQQLPRLWRSLSNMFFFSRRWFKKPRAVAPDVWSVPILTGAFMLVRRDRWAQVSGFDESFFMYNEEVDLCMRLRSAGGRLLRDDRIRILHLGGGGERKGDRRVMQMVTGRMHLWRKHRATPAVWAWGAIIWTYHTQRWLGGALLRPLIGRARAAKLRAAHGPIVWTPRRWWRGWDVPVPASAEVGGSSGISTVPNDASTSVQASSPAVVR